MDLNFKNFLNHLKERDLLEIIIKSRDEAKKQAPYNKKCNSTRNRYQIFMDFDSTSKQIS